MDLLYKNTKLPLDICEYIGEFNLKSEDDCKTSYSSTVDHLQTLSEIMYYIGRFNYSLMNKNKLIHPKISQEKCLEILNYLYDKNSCDKFVLVLENLNKLLFEKIARYHVTPISDLIDDIIEEDEL